MSTRTDQKSGATNTILFLTLFAMVVIAVIIAIGFYRAQIKIFKEKELHKLECIASAVAYKIDGEDHQYLLDQYPDREGLDSLMAEPAYKMIKGQLNMAKNMNKLTDDMYTVTYDSLGQHFILGVSSGQYPLWAEHFRKYPDELRQIYDAGGGQINEPYDSENGSWLSAQAAIRTNDGRKVGALQVDQHFDNFISIAQQDIFMNLAIMMGFIVIVGVLMFLSVKSILKRQERVNLERQEVDIMRKELIANVSHDLRTPLASIQGYIETLLIKKDELDPGRFEKYLNTTLRSTEKLRTLVDELFELSRLESKERQLIIEPIALADLIHDTVNNLKIDAQKKGVELRAEVAKDLPQVKADIALIDRVLQNLISNSIKFCNDGDSVTVRTKALGNSIEVSVADTGVGISAEDLPHVFNRFHKGKTPNSGTGLGLAIVKNVLELHNSNYNIKSIEKEGTTFSFNLPILEVVTRK